MPPNLCEVIRRLPCSLLLRLKNTDLCRPSVSRTRAVVLRNLRRVAATRLGPGRLEFMRTLRLLERVLTPGPRMLDLGGGPGRYNIASARERRLRERVGQRFSGGLVRCQGPWRCQDAVSGGDRLFGWHAAVWCRGPVSTRDTVHGHDSVTSMVSCGVPLLARERSSGRSWRCPPLRSERVRRRPSGAAPGRARCTRYRDPGPDRRECRSLRACTSSSERARAPPEPWTRWT